ncbi:hypothetical protein Psta_4109 [Pirellula staleyi DSM 6068]|uniref:Uncharacterized protein n=1 Tax=Pirellula staleyi (strain ATCC 27377 / DSM 6068 / ICPB 4128) TaxID=530564 RepID=D2R326_PIRSD|nr:hypothetical protein Psta_4109 [Pirellula staleyi DSM 6068]
MELPARNFTTRFLLFTRAVALSEQVPDEFFSAALATAPAVGYKKQNM